MLTAPLLSSRQKYLRPVIAQQLFALLQARTDDACMYLVGTKLFEQDLQNSDCFIAPQQLNQLIKNSRHCPDPELAFLLGQQLMQSQDPLAKLLMSSASLRQALADLHQFQQLWHIPIHPIELNYDEQFHLDLRPLLPKTEIGQFFIQLTCSALAYWCRLKGIAVRWQLPPQYLPQKRIWQRYLGLELSFDHQDTRATLSQHDLNKALPYQTTCQQVYRQACTNLAARGIAGIHVLDAVYQHLQQHPQASLEQTADSFSMSASTLKRKLKEEGANYSKLQDDNNRYRALQLAQDLGWSNGQMADYFHISDVNNFRRAFKRWTGFNPSQLKQV